MRWFTVSRVKVGMTLRKLKEKLRRNPALRLEPNFMRRYREVE